MSAKILDGRRLAASLLEEARAAAQSVRAQRGTPPRIAIVASRGDAARSYLKAQLRACESTGVEGLVYRPTTRENYFALLRRLGRDKAIDAVITQSPFPGGVRLEDIAARIAPEKDAEGLTAQAYGQLFLAKTWNRASLFPGPCTAFAVAHLVQAARVSLRGLGAVVIGRSATVGRPTAHLLSTLDMTVTLAHSRTRHLRTLCRSADVVVAAAGVAGLVKPDWIKRGAIVVDVGVHERNGKIIGDVSAAAAKSAGFMTPVPGGVGPVTSAVLILQAVRLCSAETRR